MYSDGVSKALIQANGNSYFLGGNIGIGTTSPGTFLQLGTYAVAGKYINQGSYPDIPSEHMMHITAPSTNAYYGGGISFGETAFTAANIVVRDAGGSGALDLCFGTGTASGVTEKMRIQNNGNVGIGVTAANDINEGKLYVNGTLTLDQTSEIKYGKNNGGPYLNTRSKDGTTSACGIRIHSPVGSPGYLYGEGSGTSGTSIMILDGAGQSVFSATQGNNTQLRVNNQTHLYINNSGNVGIGTTVFPSSGFAKLVVAGGAIAARPSGVNDYFSYIKSNWALENAFEIGIEGAGTQHRFITSGNYYHGTEFYYTFLHPFNYKIVIT